MEKYTAGNYGKAYLANNAALDIVGRGDVRVKLPSGARWVLHNVMHVPGLKRNLISVSQLTKEGYQVEGFVVMKGPLVLSYGFEEVPDFTRRRLILRRRTWFEAGNRVPLGRSC